MQIDHKVLQWKGGSSLDATSIPIQRTQTFTRLYEFSSPALLARSTESNVCMHNLPEQETIAAK